MRWMGGTSAAWEEGCGDDSIWTLGALVVFQDKPRHSCTGFQLKYRGTSNRSQPFFAHLMEFSRPIPPESDAIFI